MTIAGVVKRVGDWMYGPGEPVEDVPLLKIEVPVPKELVPVYATKPEELEVIVRPKRAVPPEKKPAKKAAKAKPRKGGA